MKRLLPILIVVMLLCCACGNLHEECKEELFELECDITELQDELDDMYERLLSYDYAMDEVRSALMTAVEYYEGYDFISKEEAIGSIYYAVELTRPDY
jgi:hypothetical protein